MTRMKVGVVGAGQVGGTCAQRILERGLADVALVDVVEGLAQGKALDLSHASPVEDYESCRITGSTDLQILEGADLVVVTAGLARKPGMTRFDLLESNAKILRPIAERIRAVCPFSIVLVVTNPLDVMTQVVFEATGFGRRRVIGMAGVLDTARFRFHVAERLGVAPNQVEAIVLGGHGDTMVPLPRLAAVSGKPLSKLLSDSEIDALIQRTRNAGAEVVSLLKAGSAFYAPSSAVVEMAEQILRDTGAVLPCCVKLEGEYGLNGVFCGVPVRLGRGGVSEVVTLELLPEELAVLRQSAEKVREETAGLSKVRY